MFAHTRAMFAARCNSTLFQANLHTWLLDSTFYTNCKSLLLLFFFLFIWHVNHVLCLSWQKTATIFQMINKKLCFISISIDFKKLLYILLIKSINLNRYLMYKRNAKSLPPFRSYATSKGQIYFDNTPLKMLSAFSWNPPSRKSFIIYRLSLAV